MTDEERFPAGHLRGVARYGRLGKRALPTYPRTDLLIFLTVDSLISDVMAPLLRLSVAMQWYTLVSLMLID